MTIAAARYGLFALLLIAVGSVTAMLARDRGRVADEPAPCCQTHGQASAAPLFDVPEFTLTERSGSPVTRSDLAGKVWVADFIYTTCPGPCPMMSARMAALARELPARDDLRFVSFSVDPDRDTPAVLQKYADRYQADARRWLFLTGPRDEIERLSVKGFRLALNRDAADSPGHPIVHSTRFVLVGRDGRVQGYYDGLDSTAVTKLRKDVASLLDEQPASSAPAG